MYDQKLADVEAENAELKRVLKSTLAYFFHEDIQEAGKLMSIPPRLKGERIEALLDRMERR